MANVCSFKMNPTQFKVELLKNIREFSLNKEQLKDSEGNVISSEDNNILRDYAIKCITYSLKNRNVSQDEKSEAISNIKEVLNSIRLKKYHLNTLITDDTLNDIFNSLKQVPNNLQPDYILTNYTTTKLEKDNKIEEYKESFTTRYLTKYFHNNAQLKSMCKEKGTSFVTQFAIFNNTNEKAFIIATDKQLNNFIREGQEQLYQQVREYYDKDNALPKTLYAQDGSYTGAWEQFNSVYGDKVNPDKYSVDKLNELYINSNSPRKSIRNTASAELNAYMNYVMLQEFDTILRNNLKTIVIDQSLPKFYSNTNNTYRYSLSKAKAINMNKTWRTNEDIFTNKEISNLIKLLVQNIDINDGNSIRKLQFKEFSYIIGKVKNLIFDLQGNEIDDEISRDYSIVFGNYTLQQLIASIKENPKKYLTEVFRLLSNKDFISNYSDGVLNKLLDKYDINIIKALYDNLFDSENTKSLSYANKTLGYNKGMNYFDYICQTCDGIVSAKYVQYYRDEDGGVRLRNLYDQTIVGIRRDIDEQILINNSKQFGLNKYNTDPSNLSFTLQNKKQSNDIINSNVDTSDNLQTISYLFTLDGNTYTLYKNVASNNSILYKNVNGQDIDLTSKVTYDSEIIGELANVAKYLSDLVLSTNFNLDQKYWDIFTSVNGNEFNASKDIFDLAGEVIFNQVLSNKFIEPYFQKNKEPYNKVVKKYNRGIRVNNKLQEIYLIGKDQTPKADRLAKAKAIITGKLNSSQLKDGSGNALPTETLSRLVSNVWTQVTLQNSKEGSATKDFSLFKTGVFRGVYQAKEFKDARAASSKSHTEFNAQEMESAEIFYDFLKGLQDSDKTSISDVVGNGNVAFLPSDNSDKSNIGRIVVNLDKSFDGLSIHTMIADRSQRPLAIKYINAKIQNEIGGFYRKVLENQQKTWDKFNEASQFIFNKLNGKIPPEIAAYNGIFCKAQDFETINKAYLQNQATTMKPKDFINRVTRYWNNTHPNDIITITDEQLFNIDKGTGLLLPNANILANLIRFSSEESTEKYFQDQQKIIIKDLIQDGFDGITFPKGESNVICSLTIEDPKTHEPKKFDIINRQDFANKVEEIGHLLGSEFRATDDIGALLNLILNNNKVHVEINPVLDIYNRLNYLYTQEWMASTVGGHFNHPNKIKWKDNQSTVTKKLRLNYLENPQNAKYPTSIDKYVPWNRLLRLFNYDISSLSKFIQSLDNYGTARIDKSGIFTTDFTKFIETELSKYNLNDINSIIEELSNIGFPKSYTSIFNNYLHGYTPSNGNHVLGLYEIFDYDEAGRFNSQNKRNVSFTAAMHPFALNTLDGITSKANICVINDNLCNIFTVTGVNENVPTSDGATFVNPFQGIWENGSLGAEKVGLNKKQFIHFYNEMMGSGGIIKTAGFTLNNERMRDSIGYRRMMQLMTDRKWRDQTGNYYIATDENNILRDYTGEPIQFNDNTDGVDNCVYIKDSDGNFSRFVGIEHIEGNNYKVILQPVDEKLNNIRNADSIDYIIDSNYALWNALGGYNCYELKPGDTKLTTSEYSIKKVTSIANNVGIRLIDDKTKITSQEDLYQFMKHSDIHYMPTEGAVKQGAANVENINSYLKGKQVQRFKPNFYQIEMLQAGIQLDKEHNADQEDLSIFTQVLSACAAKGYTLKQAKGLYTSLASLAKYAVKGYMKPLEQYIKATQIGGAGKRRFQQKVANLIATALMTQQTSQGVIEQVASNLIELAKQGKEAEFVDNIPYSDPSIYKKIQSIISVALTTSSIKIKMPGLLAVLCPSYNIYKLYGNRLLSKWKDGDLSKLQEEADNEHIWFQGNWIKNNDGEQIGDIELTKTYKLYVNPDNLENNLNILKGSLKGAGLNYTTEEFENQNSDKETTNTTSKGYVNVLIETPLQRKHLLDLLSNPQSGVNSVSENILVGRDLAPYNVYFYAEKDGERKRFSLYDCDIVMNRFNPNNEISDDLLQTVLNSLNPEDSLHNTVEINGNVWNVDKNSIDVHPYELIMPKVFATNFGLSYDTDLSEIQQNDQYFINRIINQNKNLIDSKYYNLAFTNMSGEPLYVLDRNQLTDSDGNLLPNLHKNESIVTTVDEYGRVSIVNSNYQTDLTLSKNQNDLNSNENLKQDEVYYYVDEAGRVHNIIVTDSLDYYINSQSANTINISKYKYEKDQDSLRDLIIKLQNSDNQNTSKYFKALFTQYQEQLIPDKITTFNSRYGNLFNKSKNTNTSKNLSKFIFDVQNQLQNANSIDDLTDVPEEYVNYIKQEGASIYNSFNQSLNLVAARIPAQSMQSFMPMKIAAFIDSDVNTTYVSTLQTYLQGSDYDIDAVSLSMYAFDKHGKFIGWSDLFDESSKELFDASLKLPFPSSQTYSISDYKYSEDGYDYNELNDIIDNKGNLTIGNDANKLSKFADFIEHINTYGLLFNESLQGNDSEGIKVSRREAILKAVNRYNNYLSRIKDTRLLDNIHKNYIEHSIYSIINNPVNQIEAQNSVDFITKPYKDLAAKSPMAHDSIKNGPGAFTTNIHAIINNQVGKKCIGIAAVGLKSFFAITEYFNNAIRNNQYLPLHDINLEFWVNDHSEISKETYKYIANVNPYNRNDIKSINDQDFALCLSALLSLATDNAKELALAKLNCDESTMGMWLFATSIGINPQKIFNIMTSPVARIIARESKGNVFTGKSEDSIGYGLSFLENGPDIPSDLKECWGTGENKAGYYDLLEGSDIKTFLKNVPLALFYGNNIKEDFDNMELSDYHNIVNLINHPENMPAKFKSLAANINDSIRKLISGEQNRKHKYFLKNGVLNGVLLDLDNETIKQLLEFISEYRYAKVDKNKIILSRTYSKLTLDRLPRDGTYNIDKDFFEKLKYWKNMSTIVRFDLPTFRTFKTLKKGADELKTLGQLLHLNQGLYTSDEDTFNLLHTISTLIKNNTINLHDLIYNKDYQNQVLNKLDSQSVFINPLRILLSNENYREYLTQLDLQFNMGYANSLKYRMIYELGNEVCNEAGAKDSNSRKSIFKKVGNFANSYIINTFLQNNDQPNDFSTEYPGFRITIPAGTEYYVKHKDSDNYFGDNPKYTLEKADSDTEIILGTAEGNASFKHYMDSVVIPNLQQGRLQNDGIPQIMIKNNKFVQYLTRSIYTKTPLGNPVTTYTPGINSSPRTDTEIMLFEDIKNAFNKLKTSSKYSTTENTSYSIPELFFLYNLITYRGQTNEKSFTRLFDDSENFGIIPQYKQFITKLDLNTDYISYKELLKQPEFLAQVLPYNSEYSSKLSKFINIDNVTGDIDLYTYTGKHSQESRDFDLDEDLDSDEYYSSLDDDEDVSTSKFVSNYTHTPVLPNNSNFITYDIQDTELKLKAEKDSINSSYVDEYGKEHTNVGFKIIHNQGNVKDIFIEENGKEVSLKTILKTIPKELHHLPIIMEYTDKGLVKTYNTNRIIDDIITLLSKVC